MVYAFVRDINDSRSAISHHKLKYPHYYQETFPEDSFPPMKGTANDFYNRVERGYTEMKKYKVVITGLARDIAELVGNNLLRFENIGKKFKDYRIVIFENDSIDGTRELIKDWSKTNPKVELVFCHENMNCKLKLSEARAETLVGASRMIKMANFRNRSLNYIKCKYSDFDFIMVADFDLSGPISIDGLSTCFSFTNWDVMTAYGVTSGVMNFDPDKLMYVSIYI